MDDDKLTLNQGGCPFAEWGIQVLAGVELPGDIKEGLRLPPILPFAPPPSLPSNNH